MQVKMKTTMVHHINDTNSAGILNHNPRPILLDFYADWCNPCQRLAPTIEELAAEYGDRAVIVKCNIEEAPETAAYFGVRSIPTILFIKDSVIEATEVGAQPKSVLKANLDRLLK